MDKAEQYDLRIKNCRFVELTYKNGILMGFFYSRKKLDDGFPIDTHLALHDFCNLFLLLSAGGWKIHEESAEGRVVLVK